MPTNDRPLLLADLMMPTKFRRGDSEEVQAFWAWVDESVAYVSNVCRQETHPEILKDAM